MRETYQGADAVLVLDAVLLQLPPSSPITERAMALYTSNWIHRLWTFQEGMLAKKKKLYFQFEDCVMTNYDMVDNLIKEKEADEERGLYGAFQHTGYCAAMGEFVILKDFIEQKLAGLEVFFPPLTGAIQQRTTTRLSDEVLCAATIMGMNLDKIAAVEKKGIEDAVVAQRRMEVFLKGIGEFPPGILFHHQKHLTKEGYRWAPATVMGALPKTFARDIDEEHAKFNGKGLKVRYPGLLLQDVPPGSREKLEIVVTGKHGKRFFRLGLVPEASSEDIPSSQWKSDCRYAVVMSLRAPGAHYASRIDAIVGTLKDPAAVHDEWADLDEYGNEAVRDPSTRIKIRYESLAWVEELPSDFALENSVVEAELVERRQKWIVS